MYTRKEIAEQIENENDNELTKLTKTNSLTQLTCWAITRSTKKIIIYLKLVDSLCFQKRARACMYVVEHELCFDSFILSMSRRMHVPFVCQREIISSSLHIFSGKQQQQWRSSAKLSISRHRTFFPLSLHTLRFFFHLLFIQLNSKQSYTQQHWQWLG